MDRYFVRGLVDGSLSTLGVVIGASTAIGFEGAAWIIIAAGLGGGVANGLSNVLGAFMAEKSVFYKRFEEIERAMLKGKSLKDTKIHERWKGRVVSSGMLDGLATILGSLLPILPFFMLPAPLALNASIATTLGLLFVLGSYVGKISRENLIFSGLKMAAFGTIVAIVAYLIKVMIII